VKIYELRSEQEAFRRRSRERATRMQGLIDLFQHGDIRVKKFRQLAGQLKADQRQDQRATGENDTPPSLV